MDPKMNYETQLMAEPILSPEPPAPAPKPQNFFSRLIGVIVSPGETFQEIGRAPRLLLPMLLMGLLAAISATAVVNRIGYENIVRKQMEGMVNAGFIPADKAEEQIKQSTTGPAATIGKLQTPIIAGVQVVIGLLIVVGVFKLFTMLMGSANSFKPLLSVVSFAFVGVALVQVVITLISIYLKPPEEIDLYNPVSSNVGALLSLTGAKLPKFVSALASWIDVFGIWRITLLAIGCAAVTPKMKTGTAAIPHILLYGLGALIASGFASMFS